jgi:2-keto-3-deoxy-6-phosphogluconate aldolase
MGTMFFDSVNDFCQQSGLKYMPFIGNVACRPSVLSGCAEEMFVEAVRLVAKGVHGFDLLGYRYTGDPAALIRSFVSRINVPVCVTGDINSCDRVREVKAAAPWAFTIGSAFFEGKFGANHNEQINKVYELIEGERNVRNTKAALPS